ncbi:MAG: lipid-binding SYLF domain-containing protein [Planctomycetota bacterium]
MRKVTLAITVVCLAVGLIACSTVPKSESAKSVLAADVDNAIAVMKAKDPGIDRFFQTSYGYAVLPKVFKGGFWVGGAHGKGHVYERGRMVGYTSMSQATLGFTFGGEFFREIIFFKDKSDLDRFRAGKYTFSAQVTGVAIKSGAAAKASYKAGMVVFVMPESGLMVDASLGGQKFKYVPDTI